MSKDKEKSKELNPEELCDVAGGILNPDDIHHKLGPVLAYGIPPIVAKYGIPPGWPRKPKDGKKTTNPKEIKNSDLTPPDPVMPKD